MPPALIVLVDASTDGDELAVALDTARQAGGVARVLLFHPAAIETDLARTSLGFRLWPQEGSNEGERFSNAFRQAVDLGYDGGVVLNGPAGHRLASSVITGAATMLSEHAGVVIGDGDGGVALLGLQQHEPALLAGAEVPSYDDVIRRAAQLRVRLVELSPSAPTSASTSASQPGR